MKPFVSGQRIQVLQGCWSVSGSLFVVTLNFVTFFVVTFHFVLTSVVTFYFVLFFIVTFFAIKRQNVIFI